MFPLPMISVTCGLQSEKTRNNKYNYFISRYNITLTYHHLLKVNSKIPGLERVAEELMGRRKWKQYQDGLIHRTEDAQSSDDDIAATDPPPALKIKTIEQINETDKTDKSGKTEITGKTEIPDKAERRETILESLIKRPATQPKVEVQEEPTDWKPADRCYFCVDGEGDRAAGGATVSDAFLLQFYYFYR